MTVEFEEKNETDLFRSRTILGEPTTPALVKFLIKSKIVKHKKNAGKLLIIIASLCLIAAVVIVLYSFKIIPSLYPQPQSPIPYPIWQTLPPEVQSHTPHLPQ